MFVEQRHELILRELHERGSLRLAELAERLGVSAVTLRRDVEHLAGQGLLKRVHGGITLPDAERRPSGSRGTSYPGPPGGPGYGPGEGWSGGEHGGGDGWGGPGTYGRPGPGGSGTHGQAGPGGGVRENFGLRDGSGSWEGPGAGWEGGGRRGSVGRGQAGGRSGAGQGVAGRGVAGRDARSGEGAALTLGMLVPSATYYYPNVIRGARERAAELGARLVLGVSRYDEAEERMQVEQLAAGGVEGLLLTLSRQPDEEHVAWLAGLDVPTVLVERRAELGGPASLLDAVASHHAHGAYLGVRHLAELGHRRVAMVTRNSPTAPRVRQGFLKAVIDFGLHADGELGIDQEGPSEAQVAAVVEAIEDGASGLLVHNDEDALLLVQHLRVAGVNVPGQVSIVAYDDEVAALSDPPLTAVAPPKSAVGRHAVDLLLRRIREGAQSPGQHLALLPELRVRDSTIDRR
ncbi:substrate-binding domain-containing protein [Nonomuraea sp. NPDC050310]|uniref:substrate-binding domain-containing protein n=1 Tax=Nonomuraea sp. NPDC050310 TaxID=3154935 RepID=UPI0033D5CA82